jgi:predicted nucleic acid-binding protein
MASVTGVFLDSSVLIAAMISSTGRARELLVRGIRGEFRIVSSDLVLSETRRNILQKAPASMPAFDLLRQVLDADLIEPSTALVEECMQRIHPKDAPIVAAATSAYAAWLATYDRKHLLPQREIVSTQFAVAHSENSCHPCRPDLRLPIAS